MQCVEHVVFDVVCLAGSVDMVFFAHYSCHEKQNTNDDTLCREHADVWNGLFVQ